MNGKAGFPLLAAGPVPSRKSPRPKASRTGVVEPLAGQNDGRAASHRGGWRSRGTSGVLVHHASMVAMSEDLSEYLAFLEQDDEKSRPERARRIAVIVREFGDP